MPVKFYKFVFHIVVSLMILYNLVLLLAAGKTLHALFATFVFDLVQHLLRRQAAWTVIQVIVQLGVFLLFVYLKFGTFFNKAVFL